MTHTLCLLKWEGKTLSLARQNQRIWPGTLPSHSLLIVADLAKTVKATINKTTVSPVGLWSSTKIDVEDADSLSFYHISGQHVV